MNELVETEDIKKLIYTIRGKEVMFDSDLAKLYKCKNGTKEINQAVKNNVKKFPERFSWILTDKEYENLRSKILTSSLDNYGGRRYNPRVFNEQGVAMLATILKSSVATEVSIAIMDAFVAMRHFIIENQCTIKSISNINNELISHSNHLNILDNKINDLFSKFKTKEFKEKIFFNDTFHDRFIIIDKKEVYHLGASINKAGNKTFAINKMNEKELKEVLINKLNNIL